MVRPLRTPVRCHLKRTEVIIGIVKEISPTQLHVLCKDTDEKVIVLNFDILALALGSRQDSVLTVSPDAIVTAEERDAQFGAINAKLKASNKVLIVGGGAVGVEVVSISQCRMSVPSL